MLGSRCHVGVWERTCGYVGEPTGEVVGWERSGSPAGQAVGGVASACGLGGGSSQGVEAAVTLGNGSFSGCTRREARSVVQGGRGMASARG